MLLNENNKIMGVQFGFIFVKTYTCIHICMEMVGVISKALILGLRHPLLLKLSSPRPAPGGVSSW